MANKLNHSVRRFVIDVEMDDKDKAFDLQSDLSRIYNNRLERITERLFEEYQVPGYIFRIRELVVDIGDISKAYLEHEIVTKYETALKEALSKLKAEATYKLSYLDRNAELVPLLPIRRDVVRYFLLKGRMLSTASNFPGNIYNLFEELIVEAPQETREMLMELIERYPEAIRRLVEQFPPPSITRVLQLFSPSYYDYIQQEIQSLAVEIRKKTPELSLERIVADLRESSIIFLGKNQRQIFSKTRYLRSVRRQMERNLNEDLLEAFPPEAIPEQERVARNLQEEFSEQIEAVRRYMLGDHSTTATTQLLAAWDTLVRRNIEGLEELLMGTITQPKRFFELTTALPSERIQAFVLQLRPSVAQEFIRLIVRLISQHSQYMRGQSADREFRDLVYAHLIRYTLEAAQRKQNPTSLAVYLKRVLSQTPSIPSELIEDWEERIKRPQDPEFKESPAQREAREKAEAEAKAKAEAKAQEATEAEAEAKAREAAEAEAKAKAQEAAEAEAAQEAREKEAAEEQKAEAKREEQEKEGRPLTAEEAEEAEKREKEEQEKKRTAEAEAEEAEQLEKEQKEAEAERAEEERKAVEQRKEEEEERAKAEAEEKKAEEEEWEPLETEAEREWEAKREEEAERQAQEKLAKEKEEQEKEAREKRAEEAKAEAEKKEGEPLEAAEEEVAQEGEREAEAPTEVEKAAEEDESPIAEDGELIDLDEIKETLEGEKDPEKAQIDFLLYLIKTGEIPWWSKNLKDPDPLSVLSQLVASQEFLRSFQKMVAELEAPDRPQSVFHFLRNFGEAGATSFLEKAAGPIFGFLSTVALALEKYAAEGHPVPRRDEFRSNVEFKWYYILRFYLDYMDQLPSPQEFIFYIVRMISAGLPISEAEVLTILRGIAFEANKAGEMRFIALLTMLPTSVDGLGELEERGKPAVEVERGVYEREEIARLEKERQEREAKELAERKAAEEEEAESEAEEKEEKVQDPSEIEQLEEGREEAGEEEKDQVERVEAEQTAEEDDVEEKEDETERQASEAEGQSETEEQKEAPETEAEEQIEKERLPEEEISEIEAPEEAKEAEEVDEVAEREVEAEEEAAESDAGKAEEAKEAEGEVPAKEASEEAEEEAVEAEEKQAEQESEPLEEGETEEGEAVEREAPEAEGDEKPALEEAAEEKQLEEQPVEAQSEEKEAPEEAEALPAAEEESPEEAAARIRMEQAEAEAEAQREFEAEEAEAMEGKGPEAEPGREEAEEESAEELSEAYKELQDVARRREVMEYYLLQGTLPDRFTALSEQQVMEFMLTYVLESPQRVERILRENAHSPVARKRWSGFSDEVTEALLIAMLPQIQKRHFHAYLILLREVFAQKSAPASLVLLSDHAFEYFATAQAADYRMDQYIRSLLKKLDRESKFSAVWVIEWLMQGLAEKASPIALSFREVLLAIRQEYEPLSGEEETEAPESPEEDRQEMIRKAVEEKEEEEEDPTIFVNNAGLAIVFSLLPSIFKSMEFLNEKGEFLNDAVRERAIHFLAYLTHQQEQTPEEELVLNKILIGWPLSKSIMKNVPLSEAEKTVAEEVLVEIIDKWPGMDGTSPASFRKSWLQRDGRLEPDSQETYVLRVDQRGFDMLLDRLPWRYGKFEVPWTKSTIRVEWR